MQKKMMQQKIQRLEKKISLKLSNEQSDDLLKVVAEIQGKHRDELESILSEAEAAGKCDIMHVLWEQDVKDHTEFSKDQKK